MGFRTNLLKFDKNNCPESFTYILANKSLTHLGQMHNIEEPSVHYVGNLNGADEISLKVYKKLNDEVEPLWNDIVDFKTLYVAEAGEYFESTVSLDDEKNGYKTLTCTSLCEAELSNLELYDIEINTEADIAREDYVITTFYNEENPDASLLHRILKDKASHYTIKHVDDSLKKLQRSFSISGTSIYSFLTGECAEQFNCLFVFNSPDRSISVYDLYTVCNGCGYRGNFTDVCPECGSDFLNYFGNDTTVYIDKENFAENIKFEVDTDSVKNCFRLVAGDDIMTATVRSLNQNGSNYLYYITDDDKKDMSSELVTKLDSYNTLYDNYTEEYEQLLEDYYKAIDDELYYTSSMMPEKPSDDEDTDNEVSISNQEILKLTSEKMSPVGVIDITTSTSISTINNAVENYAKVFVNTSLVKVKVIEGTFIYKGKESNTDYDYGNWTGTIQLTNYSDEEDIATTTLTLTVHDNYADFAQQKVMKEIASDDEDHSIYDVIGIEDLNKFKEALTYYSLNRLKSFETAIETALDTLIGINQGSKDAETYDVFYAPYCDKLDACFIEKEIRQATINNIVNQKDMLLKRMSEIQEVLNFENYLGTNLYKEFSSYRREQEYSNSNYISDGLDNAKIIERAKEFIETAKKELYKSATKQGHITADLNNLLAMKEFKPLVENFALGNFIRVNVDGVIHRLRLIRFEIDFSNLTKIPVEFSDMTVTSNGLNDVKSILSAAQSMNRTYSYTTKQAEKGENANSTFEKMYQDGLNSALYRIKNNDNEEITIDKGGLLGRTWDDIENDYSQEQMKLTHNLLVYTRDGFRSVSCALGKHNYYKFVNGEIGQYTAYGLTSDFVTSGVVNGSQIIGGDIYSTNYSTTEGTHINLLDGSFTMGGGALTYSKDDGLYVNGNGTFTGIINAKQGGAIGGFTIGETSIYNGTNSLSSTIEGIYLGIDGIKNYKSETANVTIANGVLTANGANIKGTISSNNIDVTGGKIGGWVVGATTLTGGNITLNSAGSLSGGSTYKWSIGTDGTATFNKLTANGATINGTVTTDALTATGGKIANFTISGGYLYNGIGIGTAKSCGISCGTDKNGSDDYIFWAGNGNFRVDVNGKVVCSNLNVTGGEIKLGDATLNSSGLNVGKTGGTSTIGSFSIDGNSIFRGSWSSLPSVFMCSGTTGTYTIGGKSTSGWVFGAGNNFGVTNTGALYCSSGEIGGWTITENCLSGFGGSNAIKLYPQGMNYNGDVYYLVIYDSGGSVPIGGLTVNGWKSTIYQ